MLKEQDFTQLGQALSQANSVLIILGPNAKYDQAAVAVALYQAVANLEGKEVTLLSPEPVEIDYLKLQQEFKYKIGNKDLSISFEYDEKSVDKVSYHIDEDSKKFYLIIKPQKNHKPLDYSQVSFDYTGAEADLIFLVGVHDLEKLEHLYQDYESLYQNTVLVTVNNFEPEIGTIKLDFSGRNCWSESMVELIKNMNWMIGAESATNLLFSIDQATQQLSSLTVTADTFEDVAHLMRWGGKRIKVDQSGTGNSLAAGLKKAPAQTVIKSNGPVVKANAEKTEKGAPNGKKQEKSNKKNNSDKMAKNKTTEISFKEDGGVSKK